MKPDNKPDDTLVKTWSWETLLASGIQGMIAEMTIKHPDTMQLSPDHMENTPSRVVKMFKEYFAGLDSDPKVVLQSALFKSSFSGSASDIDQSQMVHIKDIPFYSVCAHHFVTFYGLATFSYIPKFSIVGLSKIPRMIEILSKRPQVQETLTEQIVSVFMEAVDPQGCGVVVKAKHMCMCSRGVKSAGFTETTALRGNFINASTKAEFIACAVNGERFSGL